MIQVLANILAIIFSLYCIVKKFSQKKFLNIKNEEINKFFSLSLEGAIFSPN